MDERELTEDASLISLGSSAGRREYAACTYWALSGRPFVWVPMKGSAHLGVILEDINIRK